MTELKSRNPTEFSYSQLDGDTADFLHKKETNMRDIVGKAYTDLGRELKEAQDRLAGNNQYNGVFEKWYRSIGFDRGKVYRLIDRYSLLTKCEEQTQELLEDLPVSLTYEIAKHSAESTPAKAQAKAEVLSGEIKTGKAYKDRIKELEKEKEQAEQARQQAEQQAEQARKSEQIATSKYEELSEREPEVRTEYKTEYVERIPDDYEELKRKAKEYDVLQHDRTMDNPYGVELGLRLYDAIDKLSEWQKEYAWLADDVDELRTLAKMDTNMKREYERVNKFWRTLSEIFTEDNVIDGEFTEIREVGSA